ncbi:MerR family transcriptional regulator [Microbacterium sp.]|uniref:MerR family transcriptional regulator n=1 Tax=Microbacterium sp. TaxID=51671 RepID=UPI003F6E9A93
MNAARPEDDSRSHRGLYSIAVAAELVGVGVQTLRLYEAKGIIEPERTSGGTRRYSQADVDTSLRVGVLLAEGINLAGARRIIALEDSNEALSSRIAALTVGA